MPLATSDKTRNIVLFRPAHCLLQHFVLWMLQPTVVELITDNVPFHFSSRCERSESCPFCRGNLKRLNSGDLWNYIDDGDIVDVRTIFKENLKRLLFYIEKLPIADPDPMHVSYEPCRS